MTATQSTPSQLLVDKVLGAAAESGYVQKAGKHGQGYMYADDEAITTKFREAMLSQGVLVFPEEIEVKHIQVFEDPNGKAPNVLVTIGGHFVVTDGGASLKVSSLGQGLDRGDKAIYKAMTGFKKYGYRHLVMMATGDDPEQTREDEVSSTARNSEQKGQPRSTNAAVSPSVKQADSGNSQRSSNVAQSPANGNARPATQAQKNLIRAKAREAGITDEELKSLRLSITGKQSSKDFTSGDVDAMLEGIKSAAAAKALTGGEVVG